MAEKRAFRRVNPLSLAVLVLVWERPMHPYQMSQTLKQRGKEASVRINFGALYAVVESLLAQGFIEVVGSEQDGNRPARTVYGITDSGRAEMADWVRGWLGEPEKEYPKFTAALSFMGVLDPAEATQLLHRRIGLLDKRIADMRAEYDTVVAWLPEALLIEAAYELRLTETERDFAADLVARIESGALGGLDIWRQMHELLARFPDGVPGDHADELWEKWGLPKPPN
ncbi:PadR family transcriptional regulator [Nocardia sp. NPDC051030]|uniref:PadR family transcriptional regulator n=1 Tax=Nocardia sp. NPDC051030 TaxID=3155162 RepID=UPI0034445FCD